MNISNGNESVWLFFWLGLKFDRYGDILCYLSNRLEYG